MSECRFFDMCETAWDIGCDEGIERASVRNALKDARALRCSVEDIAGRCR